MILTGNVSQYSGEKKPAPVPLCPPKITKVLNYKVINPLNTKRRVLYLKTQFVPRSKHFSSRL